MVRARNGAWAMMLEAADEIERMRDERDALRRELDTYAFRLAQASPSSQETSAPIVRLPDGTLQCMVCDNTYREDEAPGPDVK